jgi:hypothetical protein
MTGRNPLFLPYLADRAKVGEHMQPQDASEKTEWRNVETDVMSTGRDLSHGSPNIFFPVNRLIDCLDRTSLLHILSPKTDQTPLRLTRWHSTHSHAATTSSSLSLSRYVPPSRTLVWTLTWSWSRGSR